jgi:hypothetical protein
MRLAMHGIVFAVALAASSCGSDHTTDPASPANFQGTFAGDLALSSTPGTLYHATMQLAQGGHALTGTIMIASLRNAVVSGTIDGTTATLTFAYTDQCAGTATAIANLVQNGTVLSGTYSNQDCTSGLTGGFSLTKQP